MAWPNMPIGDALFPVGHPYRHATIGSMADLDAASLADVRKWFKRPLRPQQRRAGAGRRHRRRHRAAAGREVVRRHPARARSAPVGGRPGHARRAGQARDDRPGAGHPDLPQLERARPQRSRRAALEVGMHVLGGLASSRLDNALVRGEQLAVRSPPARSSSSRSASSQATMDVKPGVDRATAEARFDAADRATSSPKARPQDEVQPRRHRRSVSPQIGALEQVGGFDGKGATLAEGLLYSGDPASYKKDLARIAALTPAEVQAALQTLAQPPGLHAGGRAGRAHRGRRDDGRLGRRGAPCPRPRPTPRARPPPLSAGPRARCPPVAPVARRSTSPRSSAPRCRTASRSRSRGAPRCPRSRSALRFDAGYAADARARRAPSR